MRRIAHFVVVSSVLAFVCAGPAVAPSALAAPSLSAATSCPTGSIKIPASDDTAKVQALLAQPGRNRIFCWDPGIHRVYETLKLHVGDSMVGIVAADGTPAIIDGSKRISGWVKKSPTRWVASIPGHTVPKHNQPKGNVDCIPQSSDHCFYPDDVFWGEQALHRVWKLTGQGAGDYFVDYTNKKIYIGNDPASAPVSQAVPLPVINGQSQPLISLVTPGPHTLSHLTIEKCGVQIEGAAIDGYQYTANDVDVHLCHGRGIKSDDLSTITNNHLYWNGQGGLATSKRLAHAKGTPGVVSGNVVHHNGWVGCDACYGMKFNWALRLTIENNNVHDNFGHGMWVDNNSINWVVQKNTLADNENAGIVIEISYDGLVSGNTLLGNGNHPTQDKLQPGIKVQSSGACTQNCPASIPNRGITITGNTIGNTRDPNRYGVILRQLDRGTGAYGPHYVQRVSVDRNTVAMCSGWTGAVTKNKKNLGIYTRHNLFTNNSYTVPSRKNKMFRWEFVSNTTGRETANALRDFAVWQSEAGQDADGSATGSGC